MSYRIGWFSSGEVHSEEGRRSARELLETVMRAKEDSILDIEISFVFSNIDLGERPYGDKFFKLVESYHLPLLTFSSERFMPAMRKLGKKQSIELYGEVRYDKSVPILEQWRDLYDEVCLDYLGDFERPDLCVLAGDMTIWGKPKCEQYDAINLHPARPGGPKGTWQSVIWEIIRQRAESHGVMMHLVTPELDRGPPVTFCTFQVVGDKYVSYWKQLDEELKTKPLEQIMKEEYETNPLHMLIRKDGVKRELPLIVETIRLFADHIIGLRNKVLYDEKTNTPLTNGYDLTSKINDYLNL